jgi:hypothetical protein
MAASAWRGRRCDRSGGRADAELGRTVKVVSLGIEVGLLERAGILAKKRGVSRAKLVAEGLEKLLGRSRA